MEKFIYPDVAPRCSGIYALRNLCNYKTYVGSSRNILKRIKKHFYLLKNNKHYNRHLQNSFNQSWTVFGIILLERCSVDFLAAREIYWTRLYGSQNSERGYNQCDVSENGGNIVTAATKSKISSTLMGNRSVLMLNKNTNSQVAKFESLFKAAEYIIKSGNSKSSSSYVRAKISEAARNKQISTGLGRMAKRVSAYGYKWEVA